MLELQWHILHRYAVQHCRNCLKHDTIFYCSRRMLFMCLLTIMHNNQSQHIIAMKDTVIALETYTGIMIRNNKHVSTIQQERWG